MTRRLAITLCLTLLATNLSATILLPADLATLRKEFVDAIEKKDTERVRTGAENLVAEGSATAAEILIVDGLLCDDPALEKIVRKALEKVDRDPALAWLCTKCTEHKSEAVRIQLIQVLVERRNRDAFTAVLTGLFDRSDAVKTVAILALEAKDHRGAFPHLIRALEFQEDQELELGQVANEIRRVLNLWSGQDVFGSKEFKELWRKHEEELLDPVNKKKKNPLGEIEWERRGTSVVGRYPTFFGQEILSMHVVFLIDTSSSMSEEDPLPETEGGEIDEAPQPGTRQRMKRAQNELVRMISSLPRNFRFNVISFSDGFNLLSKGLQPATPDVKRRAISFVRKLEPSGETWTDRALEAAFDNSGVRTIVVLSDGMPFRKQDPIVVPDLMAWVDTRNRFENVEIHAIGFPSNSIKVRGFLRELARQNRGKYTEIP